MTEELFSDVDHTPTVVENEDGSVKIGETVYKDKEAAFKGKAEADKHITITQAENKTLREQVQELQQNKSSAMESFLRKLEENERVSTKTVEDNYSQYNEEGEQMKASPTVDAETIREQVDGRVSELIQKQDQERQDQSKVDKIKANATLIKEALIEKFGSVDDAKLAFDAYKESPGYDVEVHNLQVEKKPQSVIDAIVGKEVVNYNKANLPGSGTPEITSTGPHSAKGWSHYKKLLKDNNSSRPGGYYHPKTQQEMRANKNALGIEAFMAK